MNDFSSASQSIAYNMDCLVAMREMPDKCFDLAVVDPPYGRGEDGGKKRSNYVRQKGGQLLYVCDGAYSKKTWDGAPPTNEYFDELFRVSKEQIIFGINYMNISLPGGGRIVWDKCNDGSDQSDAEIAFCSLDSRVLIVRYMWRGMLQGKSISEGTIQQGNKKLNEARIHPTQKPIALYAWIFNRYAKPGMKVLDTHLGSGSSRIAAYDAGLDFVGFEIDKEYFDKQEERFAAYAAQTSLFHGR